MESDAAERLARRYPTSRRPLRDWRVVAGAVAAIGAGWLVWAATLGANPAVSARVDSFQVVSDAQVVVVVTIERPDPSIAVQCTA